MIREYTEKDLPIIDDVFQRSMLSIIPSPKIVIFLMVLMFGLRYYILILPIIIYLCAYIYIKLFNRRMLPSKHIHKYKLPKSKLLVLTHETNNDLIIGFTSIEPYIYHNSCWTTYMFIDPSYQKLGYGLKLCEALYEYAIQKMSYKKIYMGTSSIQTSQLKLQRKYKTLLEKSMRGTLEFKKKEIYPFFPIYKIFIIYIIY